MRAVTRRVCDMCVRVMNWALAHPDDEPGIVVLLAQLQALVVRMGDVITVQRKGWSTHGQRARGRRSSGARC